MATGKPQGLCTLIMPTGKLCGSPAVRNQKFCYNHIRNHRAYERGHVHTRMLERLGSQIDAMETPELLDFLHQKLARLRKTLNRFPDVHYTLMASLDRIGEITQMESILRQQVRQNQEFLNKIREYQMNSGACPQVISNQ